MTPVMLVLLMVQPQAQNDFREKSQEAKREHNLGNFPRAAELFEYLYAETGQPLFLFNAAQSRRQAGGAENSAKALAAYKAYLREIPNAENRVLVQRMIMKLELGYQRPATAASPAPTPVPLAEKEEFEVDDPFETKISRTPQPPAEKQRPIRKLAWVSAAATVLFAASAVISGVSARGIYSDLESSCGQTEAGCAPHEIERVRSRALVTNILWGATIASGLGSGVLFYVDMKRDGDATVAGISVRGRF